MAFVIQLSKVFSFSCLHYISNLVESRELYKLENWSLVTYSTKKESYKISTLVQLTYRLLKFCIRATKTLLFSEAYATHPTTPTLEVLSLNSIIIRA
jgi:hypothetical protein